MATALSSELAFARAIQTNLEAWGVILVYANEARRRAVMVVHPCATAQAMNA